MTEPNTQREEEWQPVKNHEGLYEVSNFGRVRSLPRRCTGGRVLKQYNAHGKPVDYKNVRLSKKNKLTSSLIHRLVAQAFLPNPENKPHVNHIDFNPNNNHVSNLEWCTNQENTNHSRERLPYGEKAGAAKLTNKQAIEIMNIGRADSFTSTGKRYGVSRQTVSGIVNKKNWTHITCPKEDLLTIISE